MKKSFKLLMLVIISAMTIGMFAGCAGNEPETKDGKVSGTITAAGSTALQPLAQKAAEKFKEKNPDATVNVQGGGSGTGLTQVSQGAVEIGNSDIFAEDKSGIDAASLKDHKVAVVGFSVVTNDKLKVTNLTKAQLIDIFTGKVTNWKEVGGDDKKIVVINRPKSSGTRATFKKYGLDGNDEAEGLALTEDSSGSVKKVIQETDGAIGYLALSYLSSAEAKSGLNILKLDGVEANKESITTGKYPIWSYEHMYTKGDASGAAKAYLDFMMSDEAKSIIEGLGYIPTSDMKVNR